MPQSTSNLLNPFLGSNPTNTNPNGNSAGSSGLSGIASGISNFFGNSSGVFGGSGNNGATTQPFANPNLGTGANAATISPSVKLPTPTGSVTPGIASLPSNGNSQTTPPSTGTIPPPGGTGGASAPIPAQGTAAYQAYLNSINAGNTSNGQFINDSGSGTTQGTIPPPTGVNNPNPTATYPGIVGTLASTAATSSPQYQAAATDAANAVGQYNSLVNAQTVGDQQIGGSRTNVSEAQGEAGNYNTLMTGQENAAVNSANYYLGQEGAATTQQGTQQSGLSSAGVLAAPQPGQNPLTQSFNPLTNSYSPLAISGAGPNAGTELENYGSLQQQQSIGAAAAQNNSYLGGAQVAASNLQNLITSNNLNPSSLTFANGALQLAGQYISNQAYAKLPGAINDFVTSLAPILGAGGNATDAKTQLASQFVSMLQSGATINDVVQYFTQQAQEKITGMANGGGANISGAGNTQSNGTNTGGTIFPTTIQ